jgi:hypothetical protein
VIFHPMLKMDIAVLSHRSFINLPRLQYQHDISHHVQDGYHCTDTTKLKTTCSCPAFYSWAGRNSAASLLVDCQQVPPSALPTPIRLPAILGSILDSAPRIGPEPRATNYGISGSVRAGQPAPLNEIIVINGILLTSVLCSGCKLGKLHLSNSLITT